MTSDRAAIEFRPARDADVATVAAIWRVGWQDGHTGHVPAELEERRLAGDWSAEVRARLPSTSVAVSREGDEVVGFVTVIDDELEQVYLDRSARGSGLAAELLRHGEDVVRAAGHPVAWLAVVAGNARARRFYEREGWVDGGPSEYAATTAGGPVAVTVHRHERALADPGAAGPDGGEPAV